MIETTITAGHASRCSRTVHGIADPTEVGTDPRDADSDGGGVADGTEAAAGMLGLRAGGAVLPSLSAVAAVPVIVAAEDDEADEPPADRGDRRARGPERDEHEQPAECAEEQEQRRRRARPGGGGT